MSVSLGADTHNRLGLKCPNPTSAARCGDRVAVKRLATDVQDATGDSVQVAYGDQGYTGKMAADAAAEGFALHVIKLPEAKRGFALLPR